MTEFDPPLQVGETIGWIDEADGVTIHEGPLLSYSDLEDQAVVDTPGRRGKYAILDAAVSNFLRYWLVDVRVPDVQPVLRLRVGANTKQDAEDLVRQGLFRVSSPKAVTDYGFIQIVPVPIDHPVIVMNVQLEYLAKAAAVAAHTGPNHRWIALEE